MAGDLDGSRRTGGTALCGRRRRRQWWRTEEIVLGDRVLHVFGAPLVITLIAAVYL
ncbi:MAG: hypothetical protein M3460_20950 [Actinomycetota bacterium]|nr:hypothetical protein [Actinomycetota bacterium]